MDLIDTLGRLRLTVINNISMHNYQVNCRNNSAQGNREDFQNPATSETNTVQKTSYLQKKAPQVSRGSPKKLMKVHLAHKGDMSDLSLGSADQDSQSVSNDETPSEYSLAKIPSNPGGTGTAESRSGCKGRRSKAVRNS